jgi:hypothetical protein
MFKIREWIRGLFAEPVKVKKPERTIVFVGLEMWLSPERTKYETSSSWLDPTNCLRRYNRHGMELDPLFKLPSKIHTLTIL